MAVEIFTAIKGHGVAWAAPGAITDGAFVVGADVYGFDSVGDPTGMKIPDYESSSSGSDSYLEYAMTHNVIGKYKIVQTTIDMATGSEMASSDGTAAVYEFYITAKNTPKKYVTSAWKNISYYDMVKFYNDNRGKLFLLAIPLGYAPGTPDGATANKAPCSYAIARLTSGMQISPNGTEGQSFALVFKTEAIAVAAATKTAITAAGYFKPITPYKGSTAITPPQLTEDAVTIMTGGTAALLEMA